MPFRLDAVQDVPGKIGIEAMPNFNVALNTTYHLFPGCEVAVSEYTPLEFFSSDGGPELTGHGRCFMLK